MLRNNTNLVAQAAIAFVIVIFASKYLLLAILLGVLYALLIIDTKSNIIHSERLLSNSDSWNSMILSSDGLCLLDRLENGYNAVSVSRLNVPRNAKLDGAGLESIVSKSSFAFKFSISVEKINTKSFMEHMLTKRHSKEIQLSRIDHSSPKAMVEESRLKAEISYLSEEIADFSGGGTPVGVQFYVIVSEYGENAYEAQNLAKLAIKQVSGLFDSVIGSESLQIRGKGILKVLHG